MDVDDWFLTAPERGNPACGLSAWSAGNAVHPLVNGATYFARLIEAVQAMQTGDHLFFTDWRGDADERLSHVGPTIGELFGDAARRGQVGRLSALQVCRKAAADRVHVFDLENHEGIPVYVHAKVAVFDDVWAAVGSANLNRRSWSHDSELTVTVLDGRRDDREPTDAAGHGDGARVFARDLRLELLCEHLDRGPGDDADLVDPGDAVRAMTAAADAVDAWHRNGRAGPRPPGRLRPHEPEALPLLTKLWAVPVYRLLYDPDGRSLRDRIHQRW